MIGLRSHLFQGYWVRFVDSRDGFEVGHEFCGSHTIRGAISPNSGRPLLRLLKLDLVDSRLNLKYPDIGTIPLLFSCTQWGRSGLIRPTQLESPEYAWGGDGNGEAWTVPSGGSAAAYDFSAATTGRRSSSATPTTPAIGGCWPRRRSTMAVLFMPMS